MEKNLSEIPLSIRIINFTSLVFLLMGIVLIGSFVFMKIMEISTGTSIQNFNILLNSPNPELRKSLLLAQFVTQIVTFITLPLMIIFFIYKDSKEILRISRRQLLMLSTCALIIALVSIPLIAYLSEINKLLINALHLSPSLTEWVLKSEKEAEALTFILAYYHTSGGMISGLIVIAILPAIGEELLFRGLIQTQLSKIFLNPHLAIIVTGFLFSFIHFQFLGFLPRMFLGILFGYMFYWSNSLLIPILMHFANNALTYFALNLYKQNKITVDLDSTADIPTSTVIFSALIFVFLLLWFIKISKENIQFYDFKK